MESNEINITYETLYEILKREKDSAELKKLDKSFYSNFVEYLNGKKNILKKDDPFFSAEEKKKIERHVENAKRIIKELYERREKKIINIALTKSITKSNIIDINPFLETELLFFNDVVKLLDNYRDKNVYKILNGQVPENLNPKTKSGAEKNPGKEINTPPAKSDTKMIRFISSVPKFVGKELEEYGPYAQEDIVNLPNAIADILISKGKAEQIKGK